MKGNGAERLRCSAQRHLCLWAWDPSLLGTAVSRLKRRCRTCSCCSWDLTAAWRHMVCHLCRPCPWEVLQFTLALMRKHKCLARSAPSLPMKKGNHVSALQHVHSPQLGSGPGCFTRTPSSEPPWGQSHVVPQPRFPEGFPQAGVASQPVA